MEQGKRIKKQDIEAPKKRKLYSDTIIWADLRDEYISQNISMRELSRKYGVPVSTISHRAAKECWSAFGKEIDEKAKRLTEERIIVQKLSNNERAQKIVDTLLKKAEKGVKALNARDAGSLKQYVTSMKELKDMGCFEYGVEETKNAVSVSFADDMEDFTE